jgi:NAD(P)-dependent dehydrogenase (short-subunit alcohol dehydrogenase family)
MKTIAITGATSGIGLASARMLAAQGHTIVLGARDAARGAAVVDELRAAGGRADLLQVDMASFASIRAAAAELALRPEPIDVLLNNAGVVESKRSTSVDGFETTWAVNVLGPFLLTQVLVPTLERASAPHVVNVGSTAYRIGRIPWDDLQREKGRFAGFPAYAQSKLALLMLTREFAKRYPGIVANVVHPGGIATRIWRNAPAIVRAPLMRFLPGPEVGAAPVVRLAASDETATGRYYNRFEEQAIVPRALDDAACARLWNIVASSTGLDG